MFKNIPILALDAIVSIDNVLSSISHDDVLIIESLRQCTSPSELQAMAAALGVSKLSQKTTFAFAFRLACCRSHFIVDYLEQTSPEDSILDVTEYFTMNVSLFRDSLAKTIDGREVLHFLNDIAFYGYLRPKAYSKKAEKEKKSYGRL